MEFDGLTILASGLIFIYAVSLLLKINYAVRMANAFKPYNPPMQMIYKKGKIHFEKGSRVTAWWITFWRYFL